MKSPWLRDEGTSNVSRFSPSISGVIPTSLNLKSQDFRASFCGLHGNQKERKIWRRIILLRAVILIWA